MQDKQGGREEEQEDKKTRVYPDSIHREEEQEEIIHIILKMN